MTKPSNGERRELMLAIDTPVRVDAEGRLWATSAPLIFFIKLNAFWDRVNLVAPADPNRSADLFPYLIAEDMDNIIVTPRSWMRAKTDFFRNPLAILKDIRVLLSATKSASHILFRGPSPLLPLVMPIIALRGKSGRTVYYSAGDLVKRNRGGLRGLIGSLFGWFEGRAARRYRTLVAGLDLQKRLGGEIAFANRIRADEIDAAPRTAKIPPLNLVCLATYHPTKGLDLLIEAIARMSKEDRALVSQLKIYGQGETRVALKEQIARLDLSDRITLGGHLPSRDAVIAALRAADMFILPSRSEGIPKVVLEAASFGLPIIATRVGGVEALVEPFEAAKLIEPESSALLSEAIVETIRDPSLRERLSAKSLQLALAYTEDEMLARFRHTLDPVSGPEV